QAAAEADAVKQASLSTLREELDTAASTNMAEAEAEWKRTMAEREAALQGETQLELETLEQEHTKQLATLGRKLADTEAELSGAREREALNEERSIELETKLTESPRPKRRWRPRAPSSGRPKRRGITSRLSSAKPRRRATGCSRSSMRARPRSGFSQATSGISNRELVPSRP
ncbi:MAG: hypothetical protein JRG93_05475, partial [Deltaproteobacteria bacterium]|nr:hypothetical protein [Deltaproteobacteria bacterium]